MLTGIHFLLTYACNFECDHCFLFCGPFREGTFTIDQIRRVYEEMAKIDTMEWVYFEGGEPFLYYPIMVEGLRLAKGMKLKTGIVSNAYWGTAVEDAELWLRPLSQLDISDLSLSDDAFHQGEGGVNTARIAMQAAKNLGFPAGSICIEEPVVQRSIDEESRGEPVIGGNAMFRGRAVEKLIKDLPRKSYKEFTECPHEELVRPKRIHIDPFGHTHICQGISMGNMWQTPLSELDTTYDASQHPICGPLVKGGPAELAREYDVDHEEKYVDACHFCYEVRKSLIDRFPEYLAPRQVYGLDLE